jgi:hypothetical protein
MNLKKKILVYDIIDEMACFVNCYKRKSISHCLCNKIFTNELQSYAYGGFNVYRVRWGQELTPPLDGYYIKLHDANLEWEIGDNLQ